MKTSEIIVYENQNHLNLITLDTILKRLKEEFGFDLEKIKQGYRFQWYDDFEWIEDSNYKYARSSDGEGELWILDDKYVTDEEALNNEIFHGYELPFYFGYCIFGNFKGTIYEVKGEDEEGYITDPVDYFEGEFGFQILTEKELDEAVEAIRYIEDLDINYRFNFDDVIKRYPNINYQYNKLWEKYDSEEFYDVPTEVKLKKFEEDVRKLLGADKNFPIMSTAIIF